MWVKDTFFYEFAKLLSELKHPRHERERGWKKCCSCDWEFIGIWGGGGVEHVVSGQQNLWLETDKGAEELQKCTSLFTFLFTLLSTSLSTSMFTTTSTNFPNFPDKLSWTAFLIFSLSALLIFLNPIQFPDELSWLWPFIVCFWMSIRVCICLFYRSLSTFFCFKSSRVVTRKSKKWLIFNKQ